MFIKVDTANIMAVITSHTVVMTTDMVTMTIDTVTMTTSTATMTTAMVVMVTVMVTMRGHAGQVTVTLITYPHMEGQAAIYQHTDSGTRKERKNVRYPFSACCIHLIY